MKKERKNIAMTILLLVLAIIPSLVINAEETEEEVDITYAVALNTALDATTRMVSDAIQKEVSLSGAESGWDFRSVEFASPEKAIIVVPSGEQMKQLAEAVGTEDTDGVIVIAETANSQFSKDYAEKAASLALKDTFDSSVPDPVIVLLFYDRHISLTGIQGNHFASIFLMSDSTVTPSADDAYIPKIAEQFGVTGEFSQVLYTANEMEAILKAYGSRYHSEVNEAIGATDDTFLNMALEALDGYAYKYTTNLTIESLSEAYVSAHAEDGSGILNVIKQVRPLAEEVMEIRNEELDEDSKWSWNGITLSSGEFPWTVETGEIPEFPRDKKILVASDSERSESIVTDYTLESVLPVENIPSSKEEAEMIVLVKTNWEYSGSSNGISIYDSKTIISLVDAETGENLGIIGSSFRTLSGFVMVSGDSYYAPVNTSDIKNVIRKWAYGETDTGSLN